MRKVFSPSQKANVALATIKGQQTISQLSSIYQVHPTQIQNWKKQAHQGLIQIFSGKRNKKHLDDQRLIEELYKIIGQREAELDWLKKKLEPFNTSRKTIIN